MMTNVAHLVFTLEECHKHEGGCWRYRLVAHSLDLNTSETELDRCLDIIIQQGGIATDGVCCQGNDAKLLAHLPRLIAYLQTSLQKCDEHPALWQFRISFRDQLLALRPAVKQPCGVALPLQLSLPCAQPRTDLERREELYETIVAIGDVGRDSASRWAAYLLFASLHEFLSAAPENYSIARLYAAWQRYNLIKVLYEELLEKNNCPDESIIKVEFAAAYRALSGLLLDETNSYACYRLWEARRMKQCSPMNNAPQAPSGGGSQSEEEKGQANHAANKKQPSLPHVQIRHRLRLSMFVTREKKGGVPTVLPMPAPGCFESAKGIGRNGDDRLHLRFQKSSKEGNRSRRGGDITVHRFISDELLPQYNLKNALELSRLARFRRWTRLGWGLRWSLLMLVSAIFFITVFTVIGCAFGLGFLTGSALRWEMFGVMAASILIPLIGWWGLGLRNVITLSLPRVLGGIVIGYFPLIIAQEPWFLTVYASQHPTVWAFEWLAVSVIVWGYLHREAFPFVLTWWKALWRSFKVFVWAAVLAVMIGFWLCLFAAPIYRQLKFDARRVEQSEGRTALIEPCPFPDMTDNHEKSVSLGLAYCVEVPKLCGTRLPISALLTFAPIALLLGVILQILWEEKTVTASVWPSESR